MSIAPVIRELLAAGLTGEALVAAVERIEAAREVDKGAVRAARNKRYREKRKEAALAGGETLKTDETLKTSHASQSSQGAPPNDPSPLPPHTPPITPSPNTPGSDPDGSAPTSGAPAEGRATTDDDGEPDEPAEPDFRLELFRRGADAVRRLTGMSEPRTRALIGSWLGKAGDEAVIVLRLINEAEARALADPTSWIEAQLRRRRDEQPVPPGPGRRRQAPTTNRDFWAQTALQAHETLTRTTHEQRQSGFDFEDGPAGGADAGGRADARPVRGGPGTVVRLPAYGDPGRRRAVS